MTMQRGSVVLALILITGCAAPPPEAGRTHGLATERVRVMAGNLPSTSGAYDAGHGIRIFQGLDPDVALVQEVRYGDGSAADLRELVDTAFGSEFDVVRGAQTPIPNAVVSRYPIVEAGDWDDPYVADRAFTYARIDVPGPTDLWAVSVHFLTTSATSRRNEAQALVDAIDANVPATDFVVIGGDLNTRSRGESAIGALAAAVETSGPYPVDGDGDGDTNEARSRPYDWVLASANLDGYATATVVGASSFANGLVVDTREYVPLAEIAPARVGDSGASGMQHMAVVRDFALPGDDDGGGDDGGDDGGGDDGGGGGEPDVVIDEVLANEPGSNVAGEFVELLNRGDATADLAGWTIADGVSVRHVFAAGTLLAPGARLVVFGSTASTGALGLGNSGDTVTVADGSAVISTVTYGSALSGTDGVSMTRTASDTFVVHTTVSSQPSSPGTAP